MPDDPSKDKETPRSSGAGALAVWGSLFGLFAICKLIEFEDKDLAATLFKYGLVVWVVGVFLSFIIGRSVRETKDNALGCGYIIAMGIAFIAIGVLFVSILPSGCVNNSSDWPYYRK